MVFPIVALSRAGRPIVDRSAAFRLGMAIRDSSRMINAQEAHRDE